MDRNIDDLEGLQPEWIEYVINKQQLPLKAAALQ